MPQERTAKPRLEIAHVLFIDIVGYSKLLLDEQSEALQELNQIVRKTEAAREAEAAGQLVVLPTGDGMALVFTRSVEDPVECALQISEALRGQPSLPVRMGIHSGPVRHVADVNQRENIAGAGINMAQRVMDCGDAGHILLSKRVADDLAHSRRWQPYLHELGDIEVKHGVVISVVNLYADGVGNPDPPAKFKQRKSGSRGALASKRKIGGPILMALLLISFTVPAIIFTPAILKQMRSGGRDRSDAAATSPPPAAVSIPEKSIAVLPFDNLSRDPDNAFFTDGVQDQILLALAKVADMKVISRTSVMQYKSDAPRNLREIGQQLGVAYVLEGSVQRAANKVRVNAQLINARTDAHEWAENYDRPVDDVFAIQSEIAKAIAAQLKAKLSPDEKSAIEQPPTGDLVAFDLYTRAKNLILMLIAMDFRFEKDLPEAIDLLNQAVARDPSFFHAYCLLVRAHDRLYFIVDRTPARLAQAQAALDATIRLRPQAGETHLARAYHLYWGFRDYSGALAELEKARASLPNEAEVDELRGYIIRRQGKWEESLHHLERALQLDPRSFNTLTGLSGTYEDVRRYGDAAALLERALAIYPDNLDIQFRRAQLDVAWKADTRALRRLLEELRQKNPREYRQRAEHALYLAIDDRDVPAAEAALIPLGEKPMRSSFFNAHAFAGLVARMAGNEEKARAAFTAALPEQEEIVRAQPGNGPELAALALYEAAVGRKEEALGHGRRAMELLPVEKDAVLGTVLVTLFATTATWAGEKDLALEHLNRAVQLPGGPTYGSLKLHPDWDPLRGDPRFEAIVASLAPKDAK